MTTHDFTPTIEEQIDFWEEEIKTETDWGRLAGIKSALDFLYSIRDYKNPDYPVWAYNPTEENIT